MVICCDKLLYGCIQGVFFFNFQKEESTECLVHAEDNHVPDEAAGKEENHSKQYSDSPESSDESDEEDVRDLEGRTVSAKGVEVSLFNQN